MKYAEILFAQKVGQKDTLTYSIPDDLKAKIGQLVSVPLKKRTANGIIWEIHEKKPDFKTINIKEILNETPLLSEMQISVMKWMSKYYFCQIFKILKLFLPKRIIQNKKTKESKKTHEQIIRTPTKKLSEDQTKTIDKILTVLKNRFLIRGVTGCGKTEIYAQLANTYIKQNKQVLILVPEISLTPQTIEYFETAIGIKAAVIHSKLLDTSRSKTWHEIHENKVKLIIGSRSAIFAPFKNLELIIIDEEHESSYKQDNSPRYSVHDIVEKMQEINPTIKLVLGSATPSIETSEKYKDSTINLKSRIGNFSLPEIEIVDLRDEFHKKNFSIFSDKLQEELAKILEKKEQAILFINRRGSATSVVCRDCGFKVECENCQLPMTYHSKTLNNPSLICHHCGKIKAPPSVCPVCKGANIRFLGIGTQRIEKDLKELFPQAKTLRADKDTTSQKEGFEKIYKAFKNHEADILIGTQMIAKGLHLPKVNLVGVVLADIGLNIPDFKTAERNFQLMTQVSGRAGRSEKKGKVIIQTYNPNNTSLLFTQTNDYEKFFEYERNQRKLLFNPPFGKIAKITIEDKSLKECKEKTESLENIIYKVAREKGLAKELEVNSYPSYIPRLRGKYRFILLLKDKSNTEIIHEILENIPKEHIMNPQIKTDISPSSTT